MYKLICNSRNKYYITHAVTSVYYTALTILNEAIQIILLYQLTDEAKMVGTDKWEIRNTITKTSFETFVNASVDELLDNDINMSGPQSYKHVR